MKTIKIYCLNNFQIYNTVLLTIVNHIVLHPNSLLYGWKLVPFNPFTNFTHVSPSPSGTHQSVSCIYDLRFLSVLFFKFHI